MASELPPHIKQGMTDLFELFLATLDRRVSPEDAARRFGVVANLEALDWFERPPSDRRCSRRSA